ncbi:26S protease regulatory subunit 7 [Carex littledalei]|uniref:26S protease regulatory subunit 7 n=1 Tax=Carex littledalei TaxID=544730 RepID=A0A833UY78_9POAL|nr:26S protease regulatory subunit 7 [Carex littledalei]
MSLKWKANCKGDKVSPTDIEEGMRVGVDRNKYQIQIPLPLKIDPSVTMMTVDEKPDVTYNDVGGCKEQIEKMREVFVQDIGEDIGVGPRERVTSLGSTNDFLVTSRYVLRSYGQVGPTFISLANSQVGSIFASLANSQVGSTFASLANNHMGPTFVNLANTQMGPTLDILANTLVGCQL